LPPFLAACETPRLIASRREAIATAPKPEASPFAVAGAQPLDPAKFRDPFVTATGEPRAQVALQRLETLWLNTGTLCNLACATCYIESSPTNDALVYLRPRPGSTRPSRSARAKSASPAASRS
jgi:hypothetical protein